MGYRHLTEGERYQIEGFLKYHVPLSEMAMQLKRSESTISRELSRNGGPLAYRASVAHERYRNLLRKKGVKRQCWHPLFASVAIPLLAEGLSPEQISGVFRHSPCSVSHEWLYQRILQDKREGGITHVKTKRLGTGKRQKLPPNYLWRFLGGLVTLTLVS